MGTPPCRDGACAGACSCWASQGRAWGSSLFQVAKLWPPLGRIREDTRMGALTAAVNSVVAR
ncbi:hypothetical protein GCM10011574_14660 [Microbispora bryophytorum]|uniref:Uncharacterized protein n=1 Tax=Microbispora bryophytorum TaxID=1460882 RepID=A0A8H9L914_9ACTN|nr:hypothetical protein GCM10011574_14660 [Microbispora bryophytorum]